MGLGRIAIQLLPKLTQSASTTLIKTTKVTPSTLLSNSNPLASTAGQLGYKLGGASKAIAQGNFLSSLGTAVAAETVTDLSFNVADWAADQIEDGDKENVENVIKDVLFGTLDVGRAPKTITDTFSENYPGSVSESAKHPFNLENQSTNAKRKTMTRLVGFWGVHIDIKSYDESKLSGWRHPLDRRNFGTISFCRGDVPLESHPIHFGHQTIVSPLIRLLATGGIMGDVADYVANKVHGCLAPSVTAEVSFIPVFEGFAWEWKKEKPT